MGTFRLISEPFSHFHKNLYPTYNTSKNKGKTQARSQNHETDSHTLNTATFPNLRYLFSAVSPRKLCPFLLVWGWWVLRASYSSPKGSALAGHSCRSVFSALLDRNTNKWSHIQKSLLATQEKKIKPNSHYVHLQEVNFPCPHWFLLLSNHQALIGIFCRKWEYNTFIRKTLIEQAASTSHSTFQEIKLYHGPSL